MTSQDIVQRIRATKDTIYGLELSIERMEFELQATKQRERIEKRLQEEKASRKSLLRRIGLYLRYY